MNAIARRMFAPPAPTHPTWWLWSTWLAFPLEAPADWLCEYFRRRLREGGDPALERHVFPPASVGGDA